MARPREMAPVRPSIGSEQPVVASLTDQGRRAHSGKGLSRDERCSPPPTSPCF